MQKKHQFFFSFGCPNLRGGGGSTWLGQKTKFFDRFYLKAPLRWHYSICNTQRNDCLSPTHSKWPRDNQVMQCYIYLIFFLGIISKFNAQKRKTTFPRFHSSEYINFLQSVTPHTMTKFTKADSVYRWKETSREFSKNAKLVFHNHIKQCWHRLSSLSGLVGFLL